MKTQNWTYSVRNSSRGSINNHKCGNSDWDSGHVETRHGIVSIYAQGDAKNIHISTLRFAHNGIVHVRQFPKRYTKTGLAAVATRYAREISKSK